jgi:DegV family protein with EDD domain
MANIAIVTDSTANLQAEWGARYGIQVVPLKIHWGDETFLDGVDITPREFFARLSRSRFLPITSQPSSLDFLQVFERLDAAVEGVIVPLISSGISGTVGTAQLAASQFTRLPVEVIDTRITSMGTVLVIRAAIRAIEQGLPLREVKRIAASAAERMHTYFAVDTLKYLHRGGRINTATRFLGSALDIKPILYFNDEGKIDALERARTKKNALKRLIDLTEEQARGRPLHVGIVHGDAPETAEEFRAEVERRLEVQDIFIVELSPVIGVHVGPGAIGIASYAMD